MTSLQSKPKPLTMLRMLQASGEISFKFDDLHIEIEGGFGAGSFNGTARVTFWNDREEGLSWFIGDILLDCSKWNGQSWDARTIKIEFGDALYLPIYSELEDGQWRDSIEAQIRGQI